MKETCHLAIGNKQSANPESQQATRDHPKLRTTNKEFTLDFIYAIHQLKGSDEVTGARDTKIKRKACRDYAVLRKGISL